LVSHDVLERQEVEKIGKEIEIIFWKGQEIESSTFSRVQKSNRREKGENLIWSDDQSNNVWSHIHKKILF